MQGEGGVSGSRPMSTAVHITWHGAQINFGDLPMIFTLAFWKSNLPRVYIHVYSVPTCRWRVPAPRRGEVRHPAAGLLRHWRVQLDVQPGLHPPHHQGGAAPLSKHVQRTLARTTKIYFFPRIVLGSRTWKVRWTSFADFCPDLLFPYFPTRFSIYFVTYNTEISTENIYRILIKQTGHFCVSFFLERRYCASYT